MAPPGGRDAAAHNWSSKFCIRAEMGRNRGDEARAESDEVRNTRTSTVSVCVCVCYLSALSVKFELIVS